MGVPGLLRTVLETYQKSHRAVIKNEFYDNFFIDYNGLIYDAYGFLVSNNRLDGLSDIKIEEAIIEQLIKDTKRIINQLITPTKLCYIAIDGPAPRAKMIQQRNRRYKKIFDKDFMNQLRKRYPEVPHQIWDTSKISPGTEFMDRLDKALKKAIMDGEFQDHPKAQDLKIVLNGNYVPGEAEHKYMQDVGKMKGRTCIYSNDGDMMMLGGRFPDRDIDIMVTIEKNKTLVNLYDPEQHQYAVVDLTYVDKGVHERLAPNKDCIRVVHDYILFSMLGENDFVHPFLFTHMRERGVPELFNRIYRKLIQKHQDYLVRYSEDKMPSINIPFLTDFIGELGTIEQESMQNIQRKYQNPKLNKHDMERQRQMKADGVPEWKIIINNYQHVPVYKQISPLYKRYHNVFKQINYFQSEDNWKRQYYSVFFGLKGSFKEMKRDIQRICIEWIKSLTFALVYYLDELPSWTYFYQYEVAPMPSDVKHTLLEVGTDLGRLIRFEKDVPFTPLQQQMLILPPQNEILPKIYRDLMSKDPLKPFYPETFDLNFLAGAKLIYSEPILPDIDAKLVIKETDKIRSNLNKKNRNRNRQNKL